MHTNTLAATSLTLLLSACATTQAPSKPIALGADPAAACAAISGPIAFVPIGSPSGAASVTSATWVAAAELAIAERGPTPAARINPATPGFCKVLGRIAGVDASAPAINFQVNLPGQWNGRSVQYGGGGFNGVLINAQGLPPAAPFDSASPLSLGYVTVGTDSGHQNQPGQPPQVFALNAESLVNFAHASYPKVRNASVALMQRAYGRAPAKLYFMGSSEGGREGLTMAQRYPDSFDGIFARVPVIHWTGLQHAGLRDGIATMNGGWMNVAQTKLVHDAVLAACDALDGAADGVVGNPVACKQRFDANSLLCKGAASDACLTAVQVKAVQGLGLPVRMNVELANGLREYPGRGPSGEGAPANGPTGGWGAWWLGTQAPSIPPAQANGIGWFYGAGAIQYFYAQDLKADLMAYKPENHATRVREVSALMDSTNPDLSAFKARGGKLLMLENMADYAQSPYAGIQYFESVKARMGDVSSFYKLYTAPGVDHVGAGAPGNVDMLGALTNWVERGVAPANLQLAEQPVQVPFTPTRTRPLCEWPLWPRFKGGDVNAAASFECAP